LTFDTLAFQCAVNLLPTTVGDFRGGGEIYVPAGVYRLGATITVVDKPVAFRGEGKQISRIVWDGVTGDGLSFNSTTAGLNYTLAVRSLSLLKKGTTGGAAIRGEWIADGAHNAQGVVTTTIHDVHTGTCAPPTSGDWDNCSAVSWPDANLHWAFGIQLVGVVAAKITAFDIQGGGVAGIQIAGRNPTDPPYDPNTPDHPDYHKYKSLSVEIRDGVITKVARGIETRDWMEGLHVQYVSIREAWLGMELRADPGRGLGTSVSNNYILAESRGIEATNHHGVTLTNNLIERFGSADFKGIRLSNARDFRLTGNTVRSAAAGGVGIVVDGISNENLIQGNTTVNMSTGISVAGPGVWNFVTGNVNRDTPTPIAAAPFNWVEHNH
jgi:hypothetical protein